RDVVAALRRAMGLDAPLVVQFWLWLTRTLRGDLGKSFISGYSVSELLWTTFLPTLELALATLVMAVAIGGALGLISATRKGAWRQAATAYSSLALTLPNFWTGVLAVLIFAVTLRWFPPSGRVSLLADPLGALTFLALPTLTLGFRLSGVICRFTQGALLEVLREDYIRTARAKGLSDRTTVRRHALPNALVPLVTVLGIEFGRLLGGVVIVESIFSWPGIGRLIVQAIGNRDYAVIQGALLFLTLCVIVVSLLVDVTYGLIDPRIRYS
ncbi:MAG: ABC transporter permease, partial [Armatimonadetes bacterium]|nr:ABC transporter permease [Armatimonadota bacterium]